MRIVNLETFVALPEGTLFAKYAPCYFEGLSVKADSLLYGSDFIYMDLTCNIDSEGHDHYNDQCMALEHGISINLDFEDYRRDGCFKDDQLFAVYEPKDTMELIEFLQSTLV